MPFQAWIPRSKSHRPMSQRRCFNGAMPFQAWIHGTYATVRQMMAELQWGHALSGMDTVNPSNCCGYAFVASMGPCPFRHGYPQYEDNFHRGYVASMGPCPFRHGYVFCPAALSETFRASMGPCPFRHGYLHLCLRCPAIMSSFNGAMPFQAWIRHPTTRRTACNVKLQWGHALSGMDTSMLGSFRNRQG